MSDIDVAVVGGGLAGLACALEASHGGASVQVFEASDDVGGRVRTDLHEGYRLDRGFQVLLEAYPECRDLLDYEELDLQRFFPGVLVRTTAGFVRIADPFRRPSAALGTFFAPIGTVGDKLNVAKLRSRILADGIDALTSGPDRSTADELENAGFTPGFIDRFFRPFFGGILLDPTLQTSARMFRFVWRMLAQGETSVPAFGMQEIPGQIARELPAGAVRTGARVGSASARGITLESGEQIRAGAVVVATEGPEAARLLTGLPAPPGKGVTCLYFAAPAPPVDEPIIVLNGEPTGLVNNLAVMSEVAPTYSPDDTVLISVSVCGIPAADDDALAAAVTGEMVRWFGEAVNEWRHLRTYRIPHAQPAQPPGSLEPWQRSASTESGVFVCGDHRQTASLDGAIGSGRRAARAVLGRG